MPLRNLAWLLIVPGVVLLGLAICYSAPAPDKDYKLVRQVVDVLAEVDANYYRELSDEDRQKFVEAMINGGLHELDPHSEYFNEQRLKEFKTTSEGSFGGVGIVLGIDPVAHLLKVEHPMPGTPAYNAGVVAGDFIVRIDGKPFAPLPDKYADAVERATAERAAIEQAKKQITGELGTQVTLTLKRPSHTPPEFDVALTRSRIELHPVIGVHRRKDDPTRWEWFADPQDKIALVRLKDSFSDLTTKELKAAVQEIEAAGGRGLILDLRDNPGGLLNEAIDVADLFLTEGKIVSTKNRRGNERSFSAKKEGTLFVPTPDNPRPMAVLINRHSASASEIVAAALQDNHRAVVVGERSFGKGSVQKLLYLNPDQTSAIKLTTETYWRPSGKNIHRAPTSKESDDWGVRPDPGMEVPTTEEERIRYMMEVRNLEYVPGKPGAVGPNPPPPPVPKGSDGKPLYDASKPFEDRVLNKAIEVLRQKLKG
jgi:carboxyl-terminal processing protease